jgi:hypothetical protein
LRPERQKPAASDTQRAVKLDINFPSKPNLNIQNLMIPIEEDGEFSSTQKKTQYIFSYRGRFINQGLKLMAATSLEK